MKKRVSTPPPAANGPPIERAGYEISEWCAAIPCSRTSFYNFQKRDPHLLRSCKLGWKTLVLISPAAYLAAKAREQEDGTNPVVAAGVPARAVLAAKRAAAKASSAEPREGTHPRLTPRGRPRPTPAEEGPAPDLAAAPPSAK
jgi:hypothetical protein